MVTVKKICYQDEAARKKAFAVRTKVFVEEQQVDPDLEYDTYEVVSQHYLVYIPGGEAIGTARWRETENGIKLERFAILPAYRNKQVGALLLEKVLSDTIPLRKPIYLHAQLRAVPFYQRQGFATTGEPFREAGMEHYLMIYSGK
jgi:predicted GNAT family N-acyltransferase